MFPTCGHCAQQSMESQSIPDFERREEVRRHGNKEARRRLSIRVAIATSIADAPRRKDRLTMCTLILAIGVSGAPGLYAIANRDEALDRPAEGPDLHVRNEMTILAPRDVRGGGTWLGLNATGVFAGITNRYRLPTKPHHKSRGQIVFRALECDTAQRAADAIGALEPNEYNGFHLVVAEPGCGFVVWSDATTIRRRTLSPGYHVFTERSFGAAPSPRLENLTRRLSDLGAWSPQHRKRLRRWMREHDDEAPLESTCVHLADTNYGTRSSTEIEVDEQWRFAHASGPPCSTTYVDYPDQIDALRNAGRALRGKGSD